MERALRARLGSASLARLKKGEAGAKYKGKFTKVLVRAKLQARREIRRRWQQVLDEEQATIEKNMRRVLRLIEHAMRVPRFPGAQEIIGRDGRDTSVPRCLERPPGGHRQGRPRERDGAQELGGLAQELFS